LALGVTVGAGVVVVGVGVAGVEIDTFAWQVEGTIVDWVCVLPLLEFTLAFTVAEPFVELAVPEVFVEVFVEFAEFTDALIALVVGVVALLELEEPLPTKLRVAVITKVPLC
jgi:hypothetical protein